MAGTTGVKRKSSGRRAAGKRTPAAVPRIPTHIPGLDDITGGGLPAGRFLLVNGGPGTGKTILLNEFLYRGITEAGENGVYVTFEERPELIRNNVAGLGWDLAKLERGRKLAFVDATPDFSAGLDTEVGENYSLEPLLHRIRHAVDKIGAKRVVIDGVADLFDRFANHPAIRFVLCELVDELRALGVTGMISAERRGSMVGERRRSFGFEEFVADGVMTLEQSPGQQEMIRTMTLYKLRGGAYRSGTVQFVIRDDGITVFPKVPFSPTVAGTRLHSRRRTGIKDLDKALGGGIPQGHTVLVSGNTGTGKTLFGLHFLNAALKRGESAVFVGLEEPFEQTLRVARAHKLDISNAHRKGKLRSVLTSQIDINPDQLLYEIVNAVSESEATCVVFDSVTSLPSETYSEEQTRQFLVQLVRFLKMRGVTAMLTQMVSETFASAAGQILGRFETNEMRLASLVDGIILLRYGEAGSTVDRYLNVLKLRGTQHDKHVIAYDIGTGTIGFRSA